MGALKTTPFHPRVVALAQGNDWRRWAGHAVLSRYELHHEREYAAIRNAAALIDVSPLYKYDISGPGAEKLLDRMLPRDMTRCSVGRVLYTPWCDSRGKVLDDGTVARLAPDRFRLTSADPSLRWLEDNARGLEVSIEDVSSSMAALALQGPRSRELLQSATDGPIETLKFFRLVAGHIAGVPVTVTRTGYTGDLGYEIWIEAQRALQVWDAVVAAGTDYGLLPAGIHALDVARIEAGLLMNDVDYISANRALIPDQFSTPFELGLGWTVVLDKSRYNGQEALRAEHSAGAAWGFVGLEVEWDSLERLYQARGLAPRLPSVAWRSSVPVYRGDSQVGYATSGCWSPLLKKLIALAHLEQPHGKQGTEVEVEITVEHRRERAAARVVATPFFDPERKRG